MVCRERGFESRKYENFTVRADLENRSAAIADIEASRTIERDPRGRAHALDPLHRTAVGRNAMHGTVVAAGDEKVSAAVKYEAGRIHQLGDEWLHRVVRVNFVERNRNLLPALAAECDVDVSLGVDRGVAHRMEVVGDLHTER